MGKEETIRFVSGEVELEGRIAIPAGATRGCVLCHPHPLYGGDMDNNVVAALVSALGARGIATLRFNFRGVGRSGGSHGGGPAEVGDARAAVATLAAQSGLPVAIAGYSFGASIALRVANAEPAVTAVAAIAPPLAMFDASFASSIARPMLLLVGDRDAYCSKSAFETFVAGLDGVEAQMLAGADHFFGGRETEIASEVARFVEGA